MITYLSVKTTGKVSTITVIKDIVRSFKAIRFGLIVSISNRALYYSVIDNNDAQNSKPEDEDSEDSDSEEEDFKETQDIRLGDVIISLYSKSIEVII